MEDIREDESPAEPTEDVSGVEGSWDLAGEEDVDLRPLDDEDEDGVPGHDDHGEDGLTIPQSLVGPDAEEEGEG